MNGLITIFTLVSLITYKYVQTHLKDVYSNFLFCSQFVPETDFSSSDEERGKNPVLSLKKGPISTEVNRKEL